ncbi:conserved Plasmodium protein, unknown function [Plasmodium berghei]|uniref:Uncharacterized protein n=2 Tax=Plasmodium berghei TaxID=5821 RepID=A0A509ATC0_PLABA|nr:conserved protein, unknown function [Plasmodium berghei ANKA]CXJ09559.1 conserved Plasmodium protein, unknown function [Plasmodium berghei]SCM25906.1 conserved Plasmodium protein, unknown function [Plasmodium berghei]SCN28174.1 conserved Plasmodium protein, unknown function [Plasmodium berghei]SCO62377.1 conserved Plasmodium protein, unknown function [Plasmodium berghei]SCO63935.1 conserved Plasmodium protein, unknown function [Plasmodium berghei]|eukprot:XP_034423831.1 conserved protein, unknown function [Plasmodium berghei ANKA]
MEQNSKNALDRSEGVMNNENSIFSGGAGLFTRIIVIFVDILMLINLLLDINISCDGYLRTWIIGALILSFFLMSFIKRVPTFLKEDKGLFSELILMFIFFIWTYFGTIQINKSNACQKIAPHLFWTVFTLVTMIWCSIVGLILSLMIITIGSFFFTKPKKVKL